METKPKNDVMELQETQNLILKITAYALNKDSFVFKDMVKDLSLSKADTTFVYESLSSHNTTTENPNHVLVPIELKYYPVSGTSYVDTECRFRLLPTAFYNYVDFLEIKQASEHAKLAHQESKSAYRLSMFALITSIVLGLIQIVISSVH